MDSMEKFKLYKNDWNYPISIQNSKPQTNSLVGKRVTFHEAMKVTLITGQCFGLNPVLGIRETDATKLRFTFRSWQCVYTIVSIVIQSASVLLSIMMLILKNNEKSFNSNVSTIFQLTTCSTTILFLRMAMKWPKLCVQISKTEETHPNMDTFLTKKCNSVCVVILSLAVVETALSNISKIATTIDCITDSNVYEAFVVQSFPWFWSFFSYNPFLGIMTLALNIQTTFNWNFADVFIICMSLYLTSRLDQVNKRIDAVKDKYVPSTFWCTMREEYNQITCLVRAVDEIIGGIVFVSFANNLFFICLQLLHTLADGIRATPRCRDQNEPDLRPFGGYEQAVYSIFSFSFLVVRSVAVSLTASKVHIASKEPAKALYDVSSATYCVEIQRFLDQVHGDNVSLSGLQFFNVKRGLILSIAGTIVTYELVLMQFTGVAPT